MVNQKLFMISGLGNDWNFWLNVSLVVSCFKWYELLNLPPPLQLRKYIFSIYLTSCLSFLKINSSLPSERKDAPIDFSVFTLWQIALYLIVIVLEKQPNYWTLIKYIGFLTPRFLSIVVQSIKNCPIMWEHKKLGFEENGCSTPKVSSVAHRSRRLELNLGNKNIESWWKLVSCYLKCIASLSSETWKAENRKNQNK